MIGAIVGAILFGYFIVSTTKLTDDGDAKLADVFDLAQCSQSGGRFICELIGTFVLVFPISALSLQHRKGDIPLPYKQALTLGLGALARCRWAAGVRNRIVAGERRVSINPAATLGADCPCDFADSWKRDSDWSYAWCRCWGRSPEDCWRGVARLIL